MKTFGMQLRVLFILISTMGITHLQAQQPQRPTIKQVSFPSDTLQITSFGAKGDGQFMNTDAINDAIAAASNKGGAVVNVPAGLWLTGPLEMKSNVNLHIQRDAVLLFSDDFDQYKLVESNWEGEPSWRNQNPISGKDLVNIAITGAGIIDGSGGAWRMVKKSKLTESQWKKLVASGGVVDAKTNIWYPSASSMRGQHENKKGTMLPGLTKEDFIDVKDFLRPNLLVFTSCKGVLIEGVTIQNSPAWNLHPLMCEDLTLRHVTVRNPWYAQNGDGVDIESCKNVLVEDCTFDVGDDGICIKSGRDKAGRDRAMPTENVIIRRSVVYHAHGGFVVGSEMSGGARNIWVDDCSFIGTDIGLRFKTKRGRGGLVENIFISNINMVDIPGEAILFDMYYEAVDPVPIEGEEPAVVKKVTYPVSEETPRFANFDIRNVSVSGAAKGIFVRGLPEMHIKNINMENINIVSDKGIEISEATGISLKNVQLKVSHSAPLISIDNSKNVHINQLRPSGTTELLVSLTGENSEDVSLTEVDLSAVKNKSDIGAGVSKSALKVN
ncbi:glycoside hydrolase family 28 protein [Sphingobacterium shayense]|uniref:glycoside hydrolase family 28 protein n=1 Tax=Sphingobacterium shayense TaxID=626343 RepID=UPI0015568FD3|nr:glycoside hydrolase family 28 protein [Sphingobacterium shayense]NQD69538.1 glycoside hydrolase family 28 protein [Sphingobacterium shayense]